MTRARSLTARAPRPLIVLFVLVLAALVPFVVSGYRVFEFDVVLLIVAAGSGLNLAVGYSGEFLLSQATVIGVSAYTAGILSQHYHWSPGATLPVALVVTVVWQLVICVAGLRVRGLYLGILTFFSVLVFPYLTFIDSSVTGGTDGLVGIPPFVTSGGRRGVVIPYEIVLAIVVVSVYLVWSLVASGWGIRLRYLRDAPNALQAVGVRTGTTKIWVYAVAAVPASLAGWALAYLSQSLTSEIFSVSLTLILFAGVQLVGPGTLVGPILGVGVLEGFSQVVGPFSQYNTLGLGLLLTAMVLLFPGGMVRRLDQRRALEAAPDVETPPPVAAETSGARLSESSDERDAVVPATLRVPLSEGVALELRDVRKSFGGNLAVDTVSFALDAGRVVALMGENGSGKTTLVNIITGFLRPDSGSVQIGTLETTGMSVTTIAHHGCSRTFQMPQIVGELTVRENVEVGLLRSFSSSPFTAVFAPARCRKTDRLRRAAATAECQRMGFDLGDIDRRVDSLPLGLRRLVEVARAVATGAGLICLDEPAAGLDHAELTDLGEVLRELAREGHTILLVEHNARFVLQACHDIILMREGRLEGVFQDVDEAHLPVELQRHLRREPEKA